MTVETTTGFSSSNISEFSYDDETDTLTVVFQSGDSYDYMNVPKSVYRSFGLASSKGEFFARQIKNRYTYEQS